MAATTQGASVHRFHLFMENYQVTKAVANPADLGACSALLHEARNYQRLQSINESLEPAHRWRQVQMLAYTPTSLTMEYAGVSLRRLSGQLLEADRSICGERFPLRAIEVLALGRYLLKQKIRLAQAGIMDVDGHVDNHCLSATDPDEEVSSLDLISIVEIDREHTLFSEDMDIVPNLAHVPRRWIAPEVQAVINEALAAEDGIGGQERTVQIANNSLHALLYEPDGGGVDRALQYQVGYILEFVLSNSYEPEFSGAAAFRDLIHKLLQPLPGDRFANLQAASHAIDQIVLDHFLDLPVRTALRFQRMRTLEPANLNPHTDPEIDNPFSFGPGARNYAERPFMESFDTPEFEPAFSYTTVSSTAAPNVVRDAPLERFHITKKQVFASAAGVLVIGSIFIQTWFELSSPVSRAELEHKQQWRQLYSVEHALQASTDPHQRNQILKSLITTQLNASPEIRKSIDAILSENYLKCRQAVITEISNARAISNLNRECMKNMQEIYPDARQWL